MLPEVERLRVQNLIVASRFTLKGGARHEFINLK